MRKDPFSRSLKCLMLGALVCAAQVDAAPTKRASASPVRLADHVPDKAVSKAAYLERVDAATEVPLTFVLPLRNRKALEELVQRIYDPNDELYHKYLTSDEFAKQFAPTQKDYNRVVAWAKSVGLKVKGTHSNRTLLNVSGSAASVEKAFNLNLHHYQRSDGRKFYAPDNDPEVPGFIASTIHSVVGLDSHGKRHSYLKEKKVDQQSGQASTAHGFPSGPNNGYAPSDLLTAYNLTPVSANGAGQIIAMFELGSYLESDISTYTSYFGLPSAQLKNILVDGGPSDKQPDPEVTLDIELALALAPQSQIYVYEGPNSDQGVLDTYNRIATDNLAKQVSTSWGMAETESNPQSLKAENTIFLQMAAQGQTIYAAAGDSGAYDDPSSMNIAVDDPASQPSVVGVGGTRLTVDSGSGAYSSESVWNDGSGGGAGGGGVSTVWPIPSWQTKVPTLYSTKARNVPDVALNADPQTGYAIYFKGQWTIFGGTSCAAPLWSAFTARINQALTSAGQPVLGFPNPLLYAIGLGGSYAADFHDITMGNNLYYSAGMGYDNASGWGTFNGANLFASLTNSSQVQPVPPPPSAIPQLAILMKHHAPFHKGKSGIYKIVVSNNGTAATFGAVTVAVTLPQGLTFQALGGQGWSFNFQGSTLICSESSGLNVGTSYAPITIEVEVASNAPGSVTPSATVSGGGAAAVTTTDPTTVK